MSKRVAWIAWISSCVFYIGDVYLLIAFGPVGEGDPSIPFAIVQDFSFVLVATLALVIIRSQPSNRVGWWIMVVGVTWPLEAFATKFTVYGFETWGPTASVMFTAWMIRWLWIAGEINIPFTLLYYPDGSLPSKRWRPVELAMWAVAALTFVLAAFSSGPMDEIPGLNNPVGFLPPFDDTNFLSLAAVVLLSMLPVVGLVSIWFRFRHSSTILRQQLKVIFLVAIVAALYFGGQGFLDDNLSAEAWALMNTLFTLFVVVVITAGIVRYKLFEIDRLISRTVTYAVVVGALAALYLGIVSILTAVLPSQNPLVVAASTLVVAGLFNPLRRRVQSWVDHRFNRSRYDAERVMDQFAGSLRDRVDPDEVVDDWIDVVAETMQPAAIGVWVREAPE